MYDYYPSKPVNFLQAKNQILACNTICPRWVISFAGEGSYTIHIEVMCIRDCMRYMKCEIASMKM